MTAEPWVVTYGANYADGHEMHEFFRGDRVECERIKRAFCGGSNDRKRTASPWTVIAGKARDWEEFLSDFADDPMSDAEFKAFYERIRGKP